jgi:adenosine deaminase
VKREATNQPPAPAEHPAPASRLARQHDTNAPIVLAAPIEQFIRRMPKVELHLHLEGSARAATLLDMAAHNGVALPAADVPALEERFRYNSLQEFIRVYMDCVRAIVSGADFERLAYELALDLAAQQVYYAEVMISPMQYLLRGLDFDEILEGIAAGYARAERETGIVVRTAFDYGRQYGVERAWEALAIARAARDRGVVAFSIGGDELNHPPERFQPVFAAAAESGLRLMAHAGEIVGPASVWGAVQVLGCERIGHGIHSIDDPALLAELRERRVMLDVSPTSNLRTGASPSLEAHPLRRLFEAGVRISINSDDPTFFQTTLTDEFRLAVGHFGFSVDEICAVILDSARATFLLPEQQAALIARIEAGQIALRQELAL